MEFRIQDVARVSKASIKLEGITVLAGPNGSGKSTISRALVTLGALAASLDERIRIERLRSLSDLFLRAGWYRRSPLRLSFLDRLSREEQSRWLDFDFAGSAEDVYDWCSAQSANFPVWERRLFTEDATTYREQFLENYKRLIPKIKEIVTRPDKDYEAFVITQTFRSVFCNQMNAKWLQAAKQATVALALDECKIRVVFEQEECSDYGGFSGRSSVRFCYLEPVHLLDKVVASRIRAWQDESSRYGQGAVDWEAVLQGVNGCPTLEEAKALSAAQTILKEVIKTIHGHLDITEIGLAFRDEEVGCAIEVANVASGAKSMAMIIRALETGHLTENSVLVIDEPETNLHSAWLVRFAEFLVLIAKHLKIKVLLNTHNPFFMMALEKFARREGLWEALKVYQMVPAEGEMGNETPMFEAQEVTGNHEAFYDALAMPLDELRVL